MANKPPIIDPMRAAPAPRIAVVIYGFIAVLRETREAPDARVGPSARRLHLTFDSINQVEKHAARVLVRRVVRQRQNRRELQPQALHFESEQINQPHVWQTRLFGSSRYPMVDKSRHRVASATAEVTHFKRSLTRRE